MQVLTRQQDNREVHNSLLSSYARCNPTVNTNNASFQSFFSRCQAYKSIVSRETFEKLPFYHSFLPFRATIPLPISEQCCIKSYSPDCCSNNEPLFARHSFYSKHGPFLIVSKKHQHKIRLLNAKLQPRKNIAPLFYIPFFIVESNYILPKTRAKIAFRPTGAARFAIKEQKNAFLQA